MQPRHRFLPLLPLLVTAASAAVNFVVDDPIIAIRPGETFSITLRIQATAGEALTGFDFQWEIDSAGDGLFTLDSRDDTGSLFGFSVTPSLSPSGEMLAPRNSSQLGAGLSDLDSSVSTGTWFVASYSFTASSSVVGSYSLNTYSQPGSGWVAAGPGFDSFPLDHHASVLVNIAPIPEPASVAPIAGIVAVLAAVGRRRRRRR